jgi:DNA polymerase-3 subunit epsilon
MALEVVLDTETTGMDPNDGHKLIEIGCVELENHLPTGRTLQIYINPERDIPADATAVHGITEEFVADKPIFSQVYTDFIDFIGESKLIIHNAEFDMKFLNYELKAVGHPGLKWSRVIDTLAIARKKYPGSPANLDALCRRFEIDNSGRTYHGALLDSELLAEVYLELIGGRQHGMGLDDGNKESSGSSDSGGLRIKTNRPVREARPYSASEAELAAHAEMLEKLGEDALWRKKG